MIVYLGHDQTPIQNSSATHLSPKDFQIYLWTPQGCQACRTSTDENRPTIFTKDGQMIPFLINCLELLSRYRLKIETFGNVLISVELKNWDPTLFQAGTQIITELIDSMETLDMTYQTDLQGSINRAPSEKESNIIDIHETF